MRTSCRFKKVLQKVLLTSLEKSASIQPRSGFQECCKKIKEVPMEKFLATLGIDAGQPRTLKDQSANELSASPHGSEALRSSAFHVSSECLTHRF